MLTVSFLFFSSRRRHTRYWRDWSSDVCSSDLHALPAVVLQRGPLVLWIDALQLSLDAGNGGGVLTNEFLQSNQVFLFLFLVFLGLRCLIDLRILWLRHALGHTAAVRALVGRHEFRNIKNVVGGDQLVQVRLG